MKKLSVKDLKSIKGGDWKFFCRRQCVLGFRDCMTSGQQVNCEEAYYDCLADCV
jgi:bacteriocin-like protein